MHDNRWLFGVHRAPEALLRMFCFPHAGGGPALFGRWWRELPREVEVCPVHLPGRWSRFREEPLRDLVAASRLFVENTFQNGADLPFVLYGHSLGGLLAYEATLRLREAGWRSPCALIVSGRRPPSARLDRPALHRLPEDAFISAMARYYEPIDPALLTDAETRAILMRALRADMQMYETYHAAPAPPLDIPLVVVSGHADAIAHPSTMEGWGQYTTAPVRMHVVPGGHYFPRNSKPLMSYLSRVLRELL